MRSFIEKVGLLLFGFILGFLLIELGFRFYDWRFNYDSGSITTEDPILGWKLQPNVQVNFRRIDFSSVFVTNSQGVRDNEDIPDNKPSGVARILILGDSFTEAIQVNFEDTWLEGVESALNDNTANSVRFRTINAGCSGYGSYQEMVYFEKYGIDFEPDIVLIVFFPNDVTDDAYIKEVLPQIRQKFQNPDDMLVPRISKKTTSTQHGIKDFIKERSFFYRFVAAKVKQNITLRNFLISVGIIVDDKNKFGPKRGPSRHLYRWFQVHFSNNETEEDKELWENSLASLSRIKFLSDKINAKMGIVYMPPIALMNPEEFSAEKFDIVKPVTNLRQLTNSLEVPFFDLTPIFHKNGGKDLYGPVDHHLSKKGHQVVADVMSDWLVENFIY